MCLRGLHQSNQQFSINILRVLVHMCIRQCVRVAHAGITFLVWFHLFR